MALDINILRFRQAIEALYTGKCDIYRLGSTRREDGSIKPGYEKKYEGLKCRLSYLSSDSADGDVSSLISQYINLIISPETDIKAGDRVEVTQNGETVKYEAAAPIKAYATHKEIKLKLMKDRA